MTPYNTASLGFGKDGHLNNELLYVNYLFCKVLKLGPPPTSVHNSRKLM